MLEKVGQDKVAEALKEAAQVLRTVVEERDTALSKLAQIELRGRCEKLASNMQSKGVSSEPFDYVVSNLEKMAAQGKLDEMERAVNLVGPDMGQKLGHAAHLNSDQAQGGSSLLETFLLDG
jgi:hypothetical protein